MASWLAFTALLALLGLGALALQFFAHMRQLQVKVDGQFTLPDTTRYRPMLRLLSDDDASFVTRNKADVKKLRAERNQLFRSYLRCLTKDYGRLLGGIRLAMVRSNVDRPELAKALRTNQLHFTLALCRIEFRLRLHAAGIGKVDVSGLVGAIETMRTQASYMSRAQMTLG